MKNVESSSAIEDPTLIVDQMVKDLKPDDTAVATGGMSMIATLPAALWAKGKLIVAAFRDRDTETAADNTTQLVNTCVGATYAANNLALNILGYLNITVVVLVTLKLATSILGWTFLAIETIVELGRLYRLHRFEKELNIGDLKQYQQNTPESKQALLRRLAKIQCAYFCPTPAEISGKPKDLVRVMSRKIQAMSRILRPWMVKDIQKDVRSIMGGILVDDTEKITQGIELLKQVQTQIDKTQKVYCVGLLTLFLAMAAFGLAMITAPWAFPLYVVAFAGVFFLEFARWFAPASYLDQKNHKWNWDPWIPEKLKKIFGHQQQITPAEVVVEPPKKLSEIQQIVHSARSLIVSKWEQVGDEWRKKSA